MSTKTNEVAKKFVQIPLGHEILVKFPKYTLGSFSCIHSLIFKKNMTWLIKLIYYLLKEWNTTDFQKFHWTHVSFTQSMISFASKLNWGIIDIHHCLSASHSELILDGDTSVPYAISTYLMKLMIFI